MGGFFVKSPVNALMDDGKSYKTELEEEKVATQKRRDVGIRVQNLGKIIAFPATGLYEAFFKSK